MQAGLLTEWIEIEREVTVRDKFGGAKQAWERAFRMRARVQFNRGDYGMENREMFHSEVKTVTVRYQKGLTNKMRLSWGGQKYRILSLDRNRQEMSWVMKVELINE